MAQSRELGEDVMGHIMVMASAMVWNDNISRVNHDLRRLFRISEMTIGGPVFSPKVSKLVLFVSRAGICPDERVILGAWPCNAESDRDFLIDAFVGAPRTGDFPYAAEMAAAINEFWREVKARDKRESLEFLLS